MLRLMVISSLLVCVQCQNYRYEEPYSFSSLLEQDFPSFHYPRFEEELQEAEAISENVATPQAIHLAAPDVQVNSVRYTKAKVDPVSSAPKYRHSEEKYVNYYATPKYHFKYGVQDLHTGDIHSQEEERDADKVKGYYTLQEADGTTRIVHYTADKHSGFNAIVERREPDPIQVAEH